MPKSTITPGPWKARIAGSNQQVMGANIDSETERTEQGYLRGICFCCQNNCEANAQAIAAVPDMIEALKSILDDSKDRDNDVAVATAALRKAGQIE